MHSEFNQRTEPDHALPPDLDCYRAKAAFAPGYEQKTFADADKRGRLRLVASPDGADGSVTLHADAALYAGLIDGDESATLTLDPARKAYVHLIRGALEVNGQPLRAGDAALLAR